MLKIISILLTAAAGLTFLHGQNIPGSKYAGLLDKRPVKIPAKRPARTGEMRGIWVATIFNMDYQRPKNVEEFKKFFSNMCVNLKNHGFNAIFFQVRPANDAFYKSKLNPWSQFLSGREGVPLPGAKNFDPLAFMIAEAGKHNLEFHAWLNPYRVTGSTKLSKQKYLNTLSAGNFARQHPELVLESPLPKGMRRLVLNPGEKKARDFIIASVMEIVQNYNIASIHFDDYFYPDNAPASVDAATYRRSNPRKLPLAEWRRNNVTMLMKDIHDQITAHNRRTGRRVRFGISPFGIWRNRKNSPNGSLTDGLESYSAHYADTRLWVRQNMIDYIVPQIYWQFGHNSAAYAAVADWWNDTVKNSRVDLYIGQAAYKLGDPGWNINELYYQMLYNRNLPNVRGSIIFSYRSMAAPANRTMQQGGRDMLKSLWKKR